MRVKTDTEGVTKDVAITEVTAENYIVPENEKHLYHCVIEVKKFDSETGKRLSRPRVQKFGKKIFEVNVAQNLKRQGYTIDILHNPTKYLEELAKQKEVNTKKAKEAKEAKAQAEQQAKIDEAVKEALAKQAEENKKAIAEAVKEALAKQAEQKTTKK